jgi:hypothetical protein
MSEKYPNAPPTILELEEELKSAQKVAHMENATSTYRLLELTLTQFWDKILEALTSPSTPPPSDHTDQVAPTNPIITYAPTEPKDKKTSPWYGFGTLESMQQRKDLVLAAFQTVYDTQHQNPPHKRGWTTMKTLKSMKGLSSGTKTQSCVRSLMRDGKVEQKNIAPKGFLYRSITPTTTPVRLPESEKQPYNPPAPEPEPEPTPPPKNPLLMTRAEKVYQEAKVWVQTMPAMSQSMLCKHFKIGSRAGREVIETLYKEGILGKPEPVLAHRRIVLTYKVSK